MEGALGSWHAVGRLDAIPDGRLHVAMAGIEPVLLLRRGQEVQAMSAICPHKFTGLEGATLDGGRVTCPLHGASFDPATGQPLDDQKWAGVLPVLPARVRDGVVEVLVASAWG